MIVKSRKKSLRTNYRDILSTFYFHLKGKSTENSFPECVKNHLEEFQLKPEVHQPKIPLSKILDQETPCISI